MCWCNPNLRTPHCGKPTCNRPKNKPPVDMSLGPLPESAATPWHPFKYTEHQMSAYAAQEVAAERERIAAWLDQDWTADAAEEREHRKFIAAKLRQHEA